MLGGISCIGIILFIFTCKCCVMSLKFATRGLTQPRLRPLQASGPKSERTRVMHLWSQITALIGTSLLYKPLVSFAEEMTGSWDLSLNEPKVTDVCWMDVAIGTAPAQRIEISLYGDIVPKTAANFKELCSRKTYGEGYKGSSFFRIISDFSVQGGNIGNTIDSLQTKSKLGSFGRAADGVPFPPENFAINHSYRALTSDSGVISMMKDLRNRGLQDSRFFITLKPEADWADGKYSAFGRVTKGMALIRGMQILDVIPPANYPKTPITVVDCGVY